MSRGPDYLAIMLRRHPHLPSYALWRAVELRKLSRLDFPEPILDLGCGDGLFARALWGEGKLIVGLDLGRPELTMAQAHGAYAAVVQSDGTLLPFAARTFGSVLANCVLEHIPDDVSAVREMARVVRPGGQVVFTVPGPQFHEGLYTYQALRARGQEDLAEAYLQQVDRRLAHYHYRGVEEWRSLLGQAGMEITHLEPYMVGPTLRIWDRIENYLTQPAFHLLAERKFAALILTPQRLRTWLFHRFLRKYHLLDGGETDVYGCHLIVARTR